jgi:4-hydroxybenzoate polyprenyltransferase
MLIRDLLRSMRPPQWIKNLFLFAAPIFGRAIGQGPVLFRTAAAFVVFCGLSSALYLVNDVCDAAEDRVHPRKSKRPIAAGRISPGQAWIAAGVLAVIGLTGAALLGGTFFVAAAAYVLLHLAYSWRLKRVVILDVFIVAAGFVIRVAAGGFVAGVAPSSWLLVCTTLIALLLALGKRRHELVSLEEDAPQHRSVLGEYDALLLDQMIAVVTAATAVAYALYCMSGETVRRFGSEKLLWTAPFVLYGIFRYLYRVYMRGEGGSPEELIVRDGPLLLSTALWIVTAAALIYL